MVDEQLVDAAIVVLEDMAECAARFSRDIRRLTRLLGATPPTGRGTLDETLHRTLHLHLAPDLGSASSSSQLG